MAGERQPPAADHSSPVPNAHWTPTGDHRADPVQHSRSERVLRDGARTRAATPSRRPPASRSRLRRTGVRGRRRVLRLPLASATRRLHLVLIIDGHGAVVVRRPAATAAGLRVLLLPGGRSAAHPAAAPGARRSPTATGRCWPRPSRRGGDRRSHADRRTGGRGGRDRVPAPRHDDHRADAPADQAVDPLRLPQEAGAGADLQRSGRRALRPQDLRRLPRGRSDADLPGQVRRLLGGRLRRSGRPGPGGTGAQVQHRAGRRRGRADLRERPERQPDPAGETAR